MNPKYQISTEKDDRIFNKDQSAIAWAINAQTYRLETRDPNIAKRIDKWKFSTLSCWGINFDLWVFTIPRKKWPWVCKNLGFPMPIKSLGRVQHGKMRRLALKKDPEAQDNSPITAI